MTHRDDRSGKDPDEAQAALDAVRAGSQQPRPESERGWPEWWLVAQDRARALAAGTTPFERRVLAALENLDARLKALEGERGMQ